MSDLLLLLSSAAAAILATTRFLLGSLASFLIHNEAKGLSRKVTFFALLKRMKRPAHPCPHCGKIYSNVQSNFGMWISKFRGDHSFSNCSLNNGFQIWFLFPNNQLYFLSWMDKISHFATELASVQFGQKDWKAR